jgi:cytochrome c oxidase subunit 3
MDLSKDKDPIINEKMKKNLVYVSIFSIIMFFAGLSSAYIVLMGDSIWIKAAMPNAFWWSTAMIFLSSMSFIYAITQAKKNNSTLLKVSMSMTLILGLLFIFFQFKGFNQLKGKGIYGTSTIMVSEGKYGQPFEVQINGDYVYVENNTYMLNSKKLSGKNLELFKSYLGQFIPSKSNPLGQKLSKDIPNVKLFYKNDELIVKKNTLFLNDSTQLGPSDFKLLHYLAQNVKAGRVDMVPIGAIGDDYSIWYKGEELVMKKRKLARKSGKPLTSYELNEAERSRDNASSFLYLLTYAHLLHVLVALIYLLRIVIKTFKNTFNSENNLSLRLTSIFWHFLGLLWGYLILFLIFIH